MPAKYVPKIIPSIYEPTNNRASAIVEANKLRDDTELIVIKAQSPGVNLLKISLNEKVRPPFDNLSSFNAAAVVLSYYSQPVKVGVMLSQLSRNSRSYAEKHLQILKGFLKWKLEITYIIEFGNTKLPYAHVYPNEENLRNLLRTEVIKL